MLDLERQKHCVPMIPTRQIEGLEFRVNTHFASRKRKEDEGQVDEKEAHGLKRTS